MKARSRFFLRPARFAAPLTFVLATIPTHAVTYYWDNDISGAGFGAAGGTWASPTANQWSTDATGVAAPAASITTGTGDDLNFGTSTVGLASGSISVGTVSARNITFGSLSGAIDLTGGSIALSGNIAASAASAATHTIGSDIVLSGNRKFGSASGEKYILTGNISGSGSSLEIDPGNTTGSVTLNGNNSFSGDVLISRGQLKVNTVADKLANSALGAGSKISMGLGGGQAPILWYSGTSAASTNRDFEFNSTGSGSIFSQDAPLTLSGTFKNIVTGATATLFLSGDAGGGANLNEVSGTVQNNGTSLMAVTVGVAAPIGGSNEHGFWKLSGDNSYSGATTVANVSTLVISHNNALGNTTGGTLVNQSSQLLLTGNIAVGAEALTLNSTQFASWNGQGGAALRNYSGSNSFAGAITLGQASTIATNTGSTLTLTGGISGAQNLTFNSIGDTTVSTTGITTGAGTLTKTGAGTLTLSAVNTYSGQTSVNAGTLVIAGNQTGATQLVVSNNGSVLQFGDGTSTNGSSVNSGTIFVNNSGTVQIRKTDGGTVINAIASNPGATTTLQGVNAAGTKNTFTATSYNNGGGFAVNSSNAGATLAFSGASGAIDLKGSNLTVSGAGDTLLTSAGQGFYSSTTASKVIKQGTGTLIFQGNQGFTGNMEIDAGTVRVDIAQTNSASYFVGNGTTPGTSAALLLGGGTTGLSGGVSFNRNVSINPGHGTNRTIGGTNTSGINSFASAIDMSGSFGEDRSVTLTAATGGTVEINGIISGSGQNISKSGSGTVVLANTNSYTGTTSVSAGTLLVNGNQAAASGTVTVSGLATLGGSGTLGGATTVNSTGIHSVGPIATGGADGVAKQTFSSSVTYNTGSIFEWNLAAVPAETGRGTSYDAVNAASLGSTTGAIFRVVLNGAQDFTSTFWDTNRTWSDIFKTGDAGSNLSIASIFSGTLQYYNGGGMTLAALGAPTAQGAFSFSGSSLVWTAVPEPTSALAGLLIGAGLLRRRRTA